MHCNTTDIQFSKTPNKTVNLTFSKIVLKSSQEHDFFFTKAVQDVTIVSLLSSSNEQKFRMK